MAIPNSLIPSEEQKPINKKRLAFAITTTSMLVLPLIIGIVSGLTSFFKPPLEDEKIFVVGLLSAYKCQLENGKISTARGQKILEEISSKHNLQSNIFADNDLREVASTYSKTLDQSCSSTVRNEKKAISEIYHSKTN